MSTTKTPISAGYADSMGGLTDGGGKSVSAGNTGKTATPSAQTSDGSFTLAAAVAVNIVNSQANATIPSGLSIIAAGLVSVSATSVTGTEGDIVYGDTANAWGTDAGTAKVGIGAAVALNLVSDLTQATIGDSTIKADGVTANAGMIGDEASNFFGANSTSGAGASNVGVAGAVAINIVNNTSQALLATGASVAAGGGDVNVTSLNDSSDLTFAEPAGAATGESLGVGASVALNIITGKTLSEIQTGAALTGAGNFTVTANSSQTIDTWGQNGASGGIALSGGVAIDIANVQTTASIGSDATAIKAAGGLTINATGDFSVDSLADSASEASGAVGIGASVVVNVTQDAVLADLDRSVTAAGPISVTGDGTSSSQATAVASEQGASGDDGSADDDSGAQSSFAQDEGASVPALPSASSLVSSPSSSVTSDSGGSDGETSLGVAASVAVNVLNSSTTATIDNKLAVITTSGSLTVGTTNQSERTRLGGQRIDHKPELDRRSRVAQRRHSDKHGDDRFLGQHQRNRRLRHGPDARACR